MRSGTAGGEGGAAGFERRMTYAGTDSLLATSATQQHNNNRTKKEDEEKEKEINNSGRARQTTKIASINYSQSSSSSFLNLSLSPWNSLSTEVTVMGLSPMGSLKPPAAPGPPGMSFIMPPRE